MSQVTLALEAADASARNDQRGSRIGRHGGQVDLPKVYRGTVFARRMLGIWYLDADVQFKAIVPYQRTRPALFRQVQVQDNGGTPSSHGQHHAPALSAYRLRGPV